MKARHLNTFGVSLIAILLISLPWLLPAVGLNISLGTTVLLFALAASSVNLLLGYTGLMAFGNAAFFGVGAYGSALFAQDVVANQLLANIVGGIAGMVAAVIIGPFLIRRREIYFALLTVAFGQVYYFIAYRWSSVTGGEDGLTISRPPFFGNYTLAESSYYFYALAIFAIIMIAFTIVVRSPFGLTLRGISQNEVRVRYLGLNSDRFIFASLVISGAIAGLAGSVYSTSINFAYPLLMDWHQSGDFVMMVVLGGSGTIWGPLLGAAIYAIGQNVLSTWTQAWQIIIGGLFVACVLLFPKGLLGLGARLQAQRGAEEDVEDVDVPRAGGVPTYEPVLAETERGR